MTAPSLCLNFRPLGRPLSLGRPIFRPRVHAGADECRSFAPVLLGFALHRGPRTTAGSLAALRAPSARQRCRRSLRNDFGNAGLSTCNRYVTEHVWIFLNDIVQLVVREVRVDSEAQAMGVSRKSEMTGGETTHAMTRSPTYT